MRFIQALLLGLVQAVTEFLPVSSFGHLLLVQELLGMQRGPGLLLEVMLHMGTAVSIVIVYRKDFIRLVSEFFGMIMDIVHNLLVYIHNKRHHDAEMAYVRVISGTWRRLASLMFVAVFATAAVGFCARRLVPLAAMSPFLPGALMLVSGVFLLVTDLGQPGAGKTGRESGMDVALWLGISQGICVFPGLSRSGLVICAGLLCGLGLKFIVKFAYIISVPAVLGAFVMEAGHFREPSMTSSQCWFYVLAAAIACLFGVLFLRFLLGISRKVKLRYFAFYIFLMGTWMLVRNFT